MSELSAITSARTDTIARATLTVATSGEGFFDITRAVARFLQTVKARDGVVLLYLQHTSASLVIQENADPDVQTDLVTALDRVAPADARSVHKVEGPDDMPAPRQIHAQRRLPARAGRRRPDGARHLARRLRRRTPRAITPP